MALIKIPSIFKDRGVYVCHSEFKGRMQKASKGLFLFHGEDWCEDCPPAIKALEELARNYKGDVSLYSVYVGTKEEWKHVDGYFVRTNPFIREEPHLQAVPTVALYIGLPTAKISLLANLTVLPDSRDYKNHLKILENILDLSERY